jgi:predicted peptidase
MPTLARHTLRRRIVRQVAVNYLVFAPPRCRAQGRERWPLLLFLHGSGERGRRLSLVAKHGPPKIVRERREFPFLMVAPQCPAGQVWSNDVVMALLDEVLARYRIDPRRVYLTGLSLGGYGTWSLASAHPERWAAVAPICGGGDPTAVLLAEGARLRALRKLPIWAFHGGRDDVVKLEESQRMVSAFQAVGGTPRLTIYPEAGHDSWTAAYNDPALYAWLLEQKRT